LAAPGYMVSQPVAQAAGFGLLPQPWRQVIHGMHCASKKQAPASAWQLLVTHVWHACAPPPSLMPPSSAPPSLEHMFWQVVNVDILSMLHGVLLTHLAMQSFCGSEQSNCMNWQGSIPTHIWTCAHAIVQLSPPPDELELATDELELAALFDDEVDDELLWAVVIALPPSPEDEDELFMTSLPQALAVTAAHRAMLAITTYVDFRIARLLEQRRAAPAPGAA
jgi:hypothetical protein